MKKNSLWLLLVLAAATFWSCSDDSSTEPAPNTPTDASIAVSVTSLTFGNVENGSLSAEQNFTISGANLTSAITVKAPTGFQVSTTTATGFADSVVFNSVNGALATTTVYAKFKPTAAQVYSGNITITATGVTKSVAVSGTGTASVSNGDFIWAKSAGSTNEDGGRSITTDAQGNIYTTGSFNGTAVFGTTTLTPGGVFITKMDANGNYIWAKRAGGTSKGSSYNGGSGIAIDAQGNVYITGHFVSTVSFGSITLTSNSTDLYTDNMFVAKLDANGNFIWAKKAGGQGYCDGNSIKLDGQNNIYVVGGFYGTAAFGTSNITSFGGQDVFVSKLDVSGNFIWTKQAGGIGDDGSASIAIDANSNIYFVGGYSGTVTFGTIVLTSSGEIDTFISKIDTNGNIAWAKSAGGSMTDVARSICCNAQGYIFVTGYFQNNAIFGSTTLTSIGGKDIFVIKMDANGNFIWSKQAGGNINGDIDRGDVGNDIAADTQGNVYLTGNFAQNAAFGSFNLVSNNLYYEAFISKMDSNGNWLWVKQGSSGSGYTRGYSITADLQGNAYVTGDFYSNVSFGSNNLTPVGDSDMFIAKIR